MADKDDDLFDSVNAMADRLKLKGRERTKYVHDHMTRGGYRAVPQYVPAEDNEDDDDDDTPFFSRRRHRSRDDDDDTRQTRRRSRRDSSGDDWYNS
jgi:hypothetical protein